MLFKIPSFHQIFLRVLRWGLTRVHRQVQSVTVFAVFLCVCNAHAAADCQALALLLLGFRGHHHCPPLPLLIGIIVSGGHHCRFHWLPLSNDWSLEGFKVTWCSIKKWEKMHLLHTEKGVPKYYSILNENSCLHFLASCLYSLCATVGSIWQIRKLNLKGASITWVK